MKTNTQDGRVIIRDGKVVVLPAGNTATDNCCTCCDCLAGDASAPLLDGCPEIEYITVEMDVCFPACLKATFPEAQYPDDWRNCDGDFSGNCQGMTHSDKVTITTLVKPTGNNLDEPWANLQWWLATETGEIDLLDEPADIVDCSLAVWTYLLCIDGKLSLRVIFDGGGAQQCCDILTASSFGGTLCSIGGYSGTPSTGFGFFIPLIATREGLACCPEPASKCVTVKDPPSGPLNGFLPCEGVWVAVRDVSIVYSGN